MKAAPPAPANWVFLLAFIVVGAPFSVGVVTTISAIQESADTQETQGTVVGFETGRSAGRGGGTVRKPVVEYSVAGQTYRCRAAVASNLPVYSVGDTVTILYKVKEPGEGFIDSFFDRWLCPLIFTLGGGFFVVVLLVALIQKIKGQKAAVRSAA